MSRTPFYPPRAGVLRGAWGAWYAFRRRSLLRFPDIPVVVDPVGLTSQNFAVVLIPTYAWAALGRRRLAQWAAVLYVVSALALMLFLGLPAAGWAAGVMITLHGLGVAEYFYSGKVRPLPNRRFLRYAFVMVLMAFAYVGVSQRLVGLIVIPLQTDEGVVLINALTRPDSVIRTEIVAFRRGGWRVGQFALPQGSYLGQVIGLPGDVITFKGDRFTVNGQPQLRRRGMPGRTELKVPPQHLFIWPLNLRQDFQTEIVAVNFAQKAALLPDGDLLGRPYRRWLLRQQAP